MPATLLFLVTLVPAMEFSHAADWPQFRGPGMSGVSTATGLPERWGPTENICWKAALPGRGVSSPVVNGNHVFVTACSGLNQSQLHVLCFACGTGEKIWERSFWATGPTICHPKTCVAAPTPVANADRVFALFASGDLVALDHGGNVCWLRTFQIDHPAMSNLVGRSASPVLHNDVLIVPMENQGASFLFGLDVATGRDRWRVERPLENNYSTPLLVLHGGRTDVIVQAIGGVTGYDPATGAKRWEFEDDSVSSIASPIAVDDLVLGVGRGIVALRLNESSTPEIVWRTARLNSSAPTPLAFGGRLYVVRNDGTLACFNVRTGKEIWLQRLRGAYSASPIVADGNLYVVNEDGETTVFRLGDKMGSPIASNKLGESTLATPAVADGRLFMRSDRWLFCVGRTGKAK